MDRALSLFDDVPVVPFAFDDEPDPTIRCGYCERAIVDPSTATHYRDGLDLCGSCREEERRRYRLATNGCGECDYVLRYHNPDGSCPTEAEARERSGDR